MTILDRFAPVEPPSPPTDRPVRILICAVQVPFIQGGAESHIESLHRELRARDFEVDVVRLPFKWYPSRQILNDALAWRLIDVTQSYGLPVDLVIGTRFPSYAVRHPRKVAWVLHQHRQAYDLLTTEMSDFKDTVEDDEARGLLYELDKRSLNECRRIFANSRNVADRMEKYLGIESEPLYHPPPLTGRYDCQSYGDYIFSAGRLEVNKRFDLLIRALEKTRHPITVRIAGKGPQREYLEDLVSSLNLQERVTFLGFITDDQLVAEYGRCGAVFYGPYDEDYGYVTLEAFHSGKAVVTTNDAGGVIEFVSDGQTGYVSDPEPESLARRLDEWFESADRGRSFGEAGRQIATSITWDNVISELTSVLDQNE